MLDPAHRSNSLWAYAPSGRLSRSQHVATILALMPSAPMAVNSAIDIIGSVFGRLTVVARTAGGGRGRGSRWACLCQCGNAKIVSGGDLRCGKTRSCGCLRTATLMRRKRRPVRLSVARRWQERHAAAAATDVDEPEASTGKRRRSKR